MDDQLEIPDFLKIDPEVRRRAWKGHKFTDARTGRDIEEWKRREAETRAVWDAERKERSRAALAKMLEGHETDTYDTKLKVWVRDPKKVRALQEREFAAHKARQ